MYQETKWVDQIEDINTKEVIQEGTDQSAGNFNNIEHGVTDAHLAALILSVGMLPALRANEGEGKEVTLKNTSKGIPFNNSTQSIARENSRDSANYDVEIQVVEATGSGIVGEFDVTDKMLNGFKLAYSGSASSVTVKLTIKGGSN